MRGGRCWAETFSAETITEEGGGDADEGCGFYEDFAAVEEVGVAVFEGGVGEDAVEEQKCGSREYEVVEVSPEGAADAGAQERGDEDEYEKVEGGGSGEIEFGLQRGLDREEDVKDAEVRRVEEEQDEGMGEGEEEGAVGGPLMEEEDIEVAMRPVADRAVAQGDEKAEEEIDGDGSDGAEAKICAEIQ
jgi:hypothetical protein